MATGETFASLTAGAAHTCGVTSAGDAVCWGENKAGQLGEGSNTNRTKPVAVPALARGLSFWLTRWGRIMGDVVVERYGEPLVAPEPGRRGNYVTLWGRLQVHLP